MRKDLSFGPFLAIFTLLLLSLPIMAFGQLEPPVVSKEAKELKEAQSATVNAPFDIDAGLPLELSFSVAIKETINFTGPTVETLTFTSNKPSLNESGSVKLAPGVYTISEKDDVEVTSTSKLIPQSFKTSFSFDGLKYTSLVPGDKSFKKSVGFKNVLAIIKGDFTGSGSISGDLIVVNASAVNARKKGEKTTIAVELSATFERNIEIEPLNLSPVLSAVNIISSDGNKAFKTSKISVAKVEGTDPENAKLSFKYQWRKNGQPIPNATSDTLSGEIKKGDKISVEVTAFDGKNLSKPLISAEIIVLNTPPQAKPPNPIEIADTGTAVVKLEASDADGLDDELTYSIVQVSPTPPANPPVIDAKAGVVTWAQPKGLKKSDTFKVMGKVKDKDGAEAVFEAVINVKVNNPPRIEPVAALKAEVGKEASFPIMVIDEDKDPITILVATNPPLKVSKEPLQVDPADPKKSTQLFKLTPNQAGVITVIVIASDDKPNGTVSSEFVISIAVENLPPKLATIGDKPIAAGQLLSFKLSATDPNAADVLTFSASSLPAGANFDAKTGEFNWTAAEGIHVASFKVEDGKGGSDTEIVTIIVTRVNQPPVLAKIGDKKGVEAEKLEFSVSASDDATKHLPIHAEGLPSGAIFLPSGPNSADFSWTPGFDQAGAYTVTFSVEDQEALKASETIKIMVENKNRPPVLEPVGDRRVEEEKVLTITINAPDPDGDPLTFTADVSALPAGSNASLEAATKTFTWTPRAAEFRIDPYRVAFTASDGKGGKDEKVARIFVDSKPKVDLIGRLSISGRSGNIQIVVDLLASTDLSFESRRGTEALKPISVSANTLGLAKGRHVFGWDSSQSFPDANGETYAIRITTKEGTFKEEAFRLKNKKPSKPKPKVPAVSSQKDVAVNGTAEANAKVEGLLNGALVATATTQANGEFILIFTGLPDGLNKLTFRVIDDFDNVSEFEAAELIVDTIKPLLTILSPQPDSEVTAFELKFFADDNESGIDTAKLSVRIGDRPPVFPTYDQATKTGTLVDSSLPQGKHKITVRVEDKLGSVTETTFFATLNRFAADKTKGASKNESPKDKSTIASNKPDISIELTDESGIKADSAQMKVDGQVVATSVSNIDTKTIRLTFKAADALKDGVHTAEISFADNNNNSATAMSQFIVDTTSPGNPPLSPITTPRDKPLVDIAGTAEAEAIVGLFVNGAKVAETKAGTDGKFTFPSVTLKEGKNAVQLIAIDLAGNKSGATDTEIVVDTTPPSVENVAPVEKIGQTKPLFAATIKDGESGVVKAKIDLNIDGTKVASTDVNYDEKTGVLLYQSTVELQPGSSHTFFINATNNAGVAVRRTFSFTVDPKLGDPNPPVISFQLQKGLHTKNRKLKITASLTDSGSGIDPKSIKAVLKGSPVDFQFESPGGQVSVVIQNGLFSFEPKADLADDKYDLEVSVKDNAGNEAKDTFLYGIDTGAPPINLDQVKPANNKPEVSVSGNTEGNASMGIEVNGVQFSSFKSNPQGNFKEKVLLAAEGKNQVTIWSEDQSGNRTTKVLELTLDTTPPTLSILKPVNRSRIPGGLVKVEISISPDSDPNSIALSLNGKAVASKDYKIASNVLEHAFQHPQNVTIVYSVLLGVNDKVGNSTIQEFEFIVDDEPIEFEANPDVVPTDSPLLSATIKKAANIVRESVKVEVGKEGEALKVVDSQFNPLTGSVTAQLSSLQNKATYNWIISASTLVGKKASIKGNLRVEVGLDTESPKVVIVSPAPNSIINDTSLGSIVFDIRDVVAVDANSVVLFINGAPFSLKGAATLQAVRLNHRNPGLLEVSVDIHQLFAPQPAGKGFRFDPLEISSLQRSLGGGQNTLGVQAADLAGNPTLVEWKFNVTIQPPQAPTISQLPTLTNKQLLIVSGSVAEVKSTNPVNASVFVNGVAVGKGAVDPQSGKYTVENVSLVIGENRITAVATDSAGNQSARSAESIVNVDISAPEILLQPLPTTTEKTALTVSGSVSDDSGLPPTSLKLVLNGTSQDLKADLSFESSVALKIGENTLSIEATDAAGNVGRSSVIKVVVAELFPAWDLNKDGTVNIFDMVIVGSTFGSDDPKGDVNGDGTVNIFDLVLVGSHFGESAGPKAAPPMVAKLQTVVKLHFERRKAKDEGWSIEIQNPKSKIQNIDQADPELVQLQVKLEKLDQNFELAGFQFDVLFDSKLLQVIDVVEGNVLKRVGNSFWLKPQLTQGRISNVASVLISEGGRRKAEGDVGANLVFAHEAVIATIATLTFELQGDLQAAMDSIALLNLKLSDRFGYPIGFKLFEGIELQKSIAAKSALLQNYPNPFNPETWIPYQLSESAEVTINIHDVTGRLVRNLMLGRKDAGYYFDKSNSAYWDGKNSNGEHVSSGLYFYSIQAGKYRATKKMVILK